MGDNVQFNLHPKKSKVYYKITSSSLAFDIDNNGDFYGDNAIAEIGLTRNPQQKPEIQVSIGFSNGLTIAINSINKRKIIKDNNGTPVENAKLRMFWDGNYVRIFEGQSQRTFLKYKYPDLHMYSYVVFFSNIRYGAPVSIKLESLPPIRKPIPLKPSERGAPVWIDLSNDLPPDAVIGGYENELLYVIRFHYRQAFTPGKFIPSESKGYIAWGGEARVSQLCQVLCSYNCLWVPTSLNNIPIGAVVAGYSEAFGELLYVGRVEHEGHLIPGKVHPSHKCCYFPYLGKEVANSTYEILVHPDARDHAVQGIDYDTDLTDFENDVESEGLTDSL